MACSFNNGYKKANEYICKEIFEPLPYAVVAPFVDIRMEGLQITNSNYGNDGKNGEAAIKSFQFGRAVANGVGFKVEIINETWEWMKQTIKALNKTKAGTLPDMKKAKCEFGWIVRDCNNQVSKISNLNFGGELLFLVQTVESSFENGVYKISVQCCDLMQRNNNHTQGFNAFGDDDNKMTLKNAVKDIWTLPLTPQVDKVVFRGTDGGSFSFSNKDGGADGPWNTWQTKEKNKLSTTRSWLDPLNTSNEKGIVQIFNNEKDLSIDFQEDPYNDKLCETSIGTYVVNGGNCTPVISFNPKINWINETSGTGAISGGASSPGGKRDDVTKANPKWSNRQNGGGQKKEATGTDMNLWRPKSGQANATMKAELNNSHATKPYEVVGSIEAELTIQGNPRYAYNFGTGGIVGKTMSIIVLNPAVIRGCEWRSKDGLNEVLTNRNWQILGVDHQITDGKYVTTFKVTLAAPNAEINQNDRLGNDPLGWNAQVGSEWLGDTP